MNKVVLTILTCALAVGCQPTTTVKKGTTSSNSSGSSSGGIVFPTATPSVTATPYPTTAPTQDYCYGTGTGSQGISYYTIPVTGRGQNTWSTTSYTDQRAFYFDSRVNIRLIPKASPGKVPALGCNYQSMPYTKLQATFALKGQNSTGAYTEYITLEGKVGECSRVAEFRNLPYNSKFFQIDVMNVKWDYDCDGNTPKSLQHACPYHPVWDNDCWALELQFSTDYTTDMPR